MTPYEIFLDEHLDERGILEVREKSKVVSEDWPIDFKRMYFSSNYSLDTIRGFHGHPKEWRWVICVSGAAMVIAKNMNNSDAYRFILDSRSKSMLHIPAGYANGWKALKENTTLMYMAPTNYEDRDDVRLEMTSDDYELFKVKNY